ncbi:MAG: arginase family protein [Flavobacteriales bacterium]|nr:arginase family protein [Flavobacteriales bacterium]
MSKASKIKSFDPSSPGDANAQMYGLPFTCEEADIVLVPVPWEVTTSYGGGTSRGPEAIFNASFQVDLFHPEFPALWKRGIAMDEIPKALLQQSKALKKEAHKVITMLTEGGSKKEFAQAKKALDLVNEECAVMNEWVEERTGELLDGGKLVGLIGGDHSTPLGFYRALAKRHKQFGVLHIDAHMDLRNAYEGFTFSHASIMYNALELKPITTVVQVGIRDFCAEENDVFLASKGRVKVVRSADIQRQRFEGITWREQCDAIIAGLPEKVCCGISAGCSLRSDVYGARPFSDDPRGDVRDLAPSMRLQRPVPFPGTDTGHGLHSDLEGPHQKSGYPGRIGPAASAHLQERAGGSAGHGLCDHQPLLPQRTRPYAARLVHHATRCREQWYHAPVLPWQQRQRDHELLHDAPFRGARLQRPHPGL